MQKRTIIKIGVSLIVVAGLGFGGYYGYNYWRGQQRRAAMSEAMSSVPAIEQAAVSDIRAIISATGTVYLKDEQSIYSSAEAKVLEVLVEEGDKVVAGQTLVKYDAENSRDNLEKQIAKAEINLSNQQLSLQSMTLPATDSEVKQFQNAVDNAEKSIYDYEAALTSTEVKIAQQQEAVAKAEKELADAEEAILLNKQLLDVGGISQTEYDTYITQRDKAADGVTDAQNALADLLRQKESNEMNIKTAEKSLQDARDNLNEAGVVLKDEADRIKYQQQQNNIKTSQLELQDYKDQLADVVESTESTLAGTVTSVLVSRGKQVDTDTILVTVADFDQLIAKANISEYDAPSLVVGQKVMMTSDGLEGIVYTGEVIKIGDSAATQNALSGTETVLPIEVSIDNVDGKIKPGYNLDLEITVSEKKDVLTVSIGAVKNDAETGEKYVYVVDNQRELAKTPVTVGLQDDMSIEVLTGLTEGSEVISTPTDTMQDGMPLMAAGGTALPDMENAPRMQGGMGGMGGIRIGGGSNTTVRPATGGMAMPRN